MFNEGEFSKWLFEGIFSKKLYDGVFLKKLKEGAFCKKLLEGEFSKKLHEALFSMTPSQTSSAAARLLLIISPCVSPPPRLCGTCPTHCTFKYTYIQMCKAFFLKYNL